MVISEIYLYELLFNDLVFWFCMNFGMLVIVESIRKFLNLFVYIF